MVEIVGKDEKHLHKVTCKNCASILQYTLSEVQTYSGRDISGGPDGCDWIDCPKCGQKAIIKSW